MRRFFSWYFAMLSMLFITLTVGSRDGLQPFNRLGQEMIFSLLAIFFGIASWIAWRERNAERIKGRRWVVTACLVNLSISVGVPLTLGILMIYRHRQETNAFWYMVLVFAILTVIGFVGLATFSRAPGGIDGSPIARRY